MPRFYETKIWRLRIPDEWSLQRSSNDESAILFRADGVGMLTVMTLGEKSPDENSNHEAFRGRLSGVTWTSRYGSTFSRTWSLGCRGQRLLVKYSCATNNAELEYSEVDEILQSIEESGTPSADVNALSRQCRSTSRVEYSSRDSASAL